MQSDDEFQALMQRARAAGAAGPVAAPVGQTPDEFNSLLSDAQQRGDMAFRSAVSRSLAVKPDQYAQQRQIAQRLGVAPAVVETMPEEMSQRDRLRQIEHGVAEAPVLRRKFTEADFAKLAQDEVPSLANLEKSIGSAVRYMMGMGEGGGAPGALKRGVYDNSIIGTAGAFRMASDLAAIPFDVLEKAPSIGGNPLRRLAEGFGMIAENQTALRDAATPTASGNFSAGVESGFNSAGQNLKYAPLAFLGPAGIAAALTGMVAEQGGMTYQKDKQEGVPQGTATIHAAADMFAEYVGERYFGDVGFLKRLAAGSPLSKLLWWQVSREVPGEMGTTLWQNFNDWTLTNPQKSVSEFIHEQGDAAIQTAVATLVGGGTQAVISNAVSKGIEGALGRQFAAREDARLALAFDDMLKASGQTALRERSPEQFRAFVQQVVDSNEATTKSIYVDGEVLAQMPEEVLAQLPAAVREQITEAAQAHSTVEIPMADVLTVAPGTPLEKALNDHARMTPTSDSRADIEAAGKLGDALRQDAERVMAQAQDQEAARVEYETVRTMYAKQIADTNRVSPAAAEAMSHFVASFYTAYGSRAGKTATQMQREHPVSYVDRPTAPGQELMSQPGTPAFDNWFGDSKVVDAEGKPLVVYHGTRGDFSVFDYSKIGQQGRSEGAGFYFTNSQKVASGYGKPLEVFLAIKKPLAYDAPGFSKAIVQKIVKRVAELEAQAEGGDIADGFLANFGDVRSEGLQPVLRAAAGLIAKDETAIDQLSGIVGSGVSPEFVNHATRDVTGYDGVVSKGFSNEGSDDNKIFVAFFPTQIKSATGNRGTFDAADPNILKQRQASQTPRGTFNPQTLEIVLNQSDAKVNNLTSVAERGQRVVGARASFSPEEKQAVKDSAEKIGVPEKEITATVRGHKLAHPQTQGWAPLTFVRAEIDEGKVTYVYQPVPYGFSSDANGEQIPAESPAYKKRVNAVAKAMTDEVRRVFQRAANGDQNAKNILAQAGWYKAMRARLRQEFGGLGDLFADLLGATSPNTPVRDNWANAVDVLRRAARGDYDALLPAWVEWADTIDALELDLRGWFNERIAEGKPFVDAHAQAMAVRDEFLAGAKSRGQTQAQAKASVEFDALKVAVVEADKAAKAYSKKSIQALPEYQTKITALKAARKLDESFLPTKESGKKYGFNGRNVARAMVDLWRVVKNADPDIGRGDTAPKALNFSGNLIGFRSRATIDVWAARMLQRLSGGLRVPSMAETGVSGAMREDGTTTLQFGMGQDIFAEAAKRIRSDAELKTDKVLAKVNDDDLQAVVWFIEKELWTVNNWTSAAGEGGSFELEASLTGNADQARIRELRRIIDSSKSNPAAKAEARQELAKLERTVDRFVGGLSTQMSMNLHGVDFVPTDADMARLAEEVRLAAYEADGDTQVLASKMLATQGRYRGVERSLDLEVVARQGYDPSALWAEMLRQAQAAKQDSTFLSRVLRDGEDVDLLRHRPGVEIYFREAAQAAQLETVLTDLAKGGVEFLTVIVDGRRMPGAVAGEMPPAVGVRLQYVPEFDQRYGLDSLLGLDDVALAAKIKGKADEMAALAERVLATVSGVAFAGQFWHDTQVAFSHQYQEKLDAIATGNAEGATGEIGGPQWAGEPIRAGLENADRQARETTGGEPDGGVGASVGGDALQQPETLGQRQQAATPRGTFNPRTLEIVLNPNTNLTTFFHETGHFFLEVLADIASQPNPPPQIAADMNTFLKWAGVADLATWRSMTLDQQRPYHERWAESIEQYTMEGKVPNVELQPLMRRFSAWIKEAYKNLISPWVREKDNPVQINDDIRRVMDRMLATDEQIAQANAAAGMLPDLDADAAAAERLNKRSMRDLALSVKARDLAIKDLQKEAKAWEKTIRAEVTAEVDEIPVYMAKDAVERAVQAADTDPVAADAKLDSIATQYGYTSVDHMAREIENAAPKAEVIDGRVDQRMLEEHGDLIDERAIQQAANAAVHNEARARSLATELRTQREMLGERTDTGQTNAAGARVTVNALVTAAKQFAANVISRTAIRDLRNKSWQHTSAERRAAKRWETATAAGKTEEAVRAKQDQVLNNAAAKAALEAEAEARKLLDYLKKFDKASVREKLPPEYLDQIDKLLERIDLRVSIGGKDIDRRASLAKWIESQHAIGLDPVLPDSLLEDVKLKSYKEMTFDEFVGLTESIKNIEHLGRLKSKLLAAKDKREFDAIVGEWADSIRANGGKPKPVKLEPDNRVVAFFKGAWAEHRKLNSLIRQMDGGEAGGPGFRFLIQSMNERGTQEDVALEKATMALAKIFAPIDALPGGASGGKMFIPEINNSLSRAGRLAVALNWGNTQNRQRVMSGDGWTEAQVGAILGTLSATELQFVNDMWAHIDSYWPDVKAKQLRVSGVVEDKVEAEPFVLTSADGAQVQMRGGYYPIKYDPDRSIRAQINDAKEVAVAMLRGAMLRPTTRRGHTEARADEVKGRPVRKDLAPITQHVSQVVHDLAWHEWAVDANRLLADPRISAAIRDHHGAEIHRAMTEAVEAVVVGDIAKQTQIDGLLLHMRANVTRSIMGVSATTALLQPFGLTQSMARIGVMPVLKGAYRWAGSAENMEGSLAWIHGKSEFMRLRAKTFNRELREINQTIQGKWKVTKVMDAVLFFPMQKMQMIADVPTWIGMYEKALADGADDATAVALADEAVLSSQGGGGTKDLAGVQRDLPFLTQFYSYFSVTLQLVAEKTALTDFKNPRAVAGWVGDMALLAVIPSILPALITFALKGGGGDDDPEKWAKRLAEWQASYLLGMFVGLRELPTLWSPFDYGGPPAGKLLNDGKRLVQQAGQGEVDDPAVVAAIGFLGTALGLPTTQIIRSYKGWKAWDDGKAPPTAMLFGPPPKN